MENLTLNANSNLFLQSTEISYSEVNSLKYLNFNKNCISFKKEEVEINLNISKDTQETILQKLNKFEKEKQYLDKDVSMFKLAKTFKTNHSYLSKIVNRIKGKSFKNYLNSLRISFAYEDLKTNKLRSIYTIKAIAEMYGFRSAENFSKIFKKVYGIYPSQYLRQLES